MSFRVGTREERTGEFRDRTREAVGERPLRAGSAMVVIQYASALLTLLCVVLAAVAGVANGLLVLATIFAVTFAWSVGAFSKNFWSA